MITATVATCMIYLNMCTLLDYKKRVDAASAAPASRCRCSRSTSPSRQKPARRRRVID